MYRIYKNILHSFRGDFKILVKCDIFQRILWLITWSLQDDQGGITGMPPLSVFDDVTLPNIFSS